MSTADLIARICTAVRQEAEASRKDPSRIFDVFDCRALSDRDGVHLYTGKAELAIPILPESPITVSTAAISSARGFWVTQDDFHVVFAVSEFLGDAVDRARVASDASFILEKLVERLSGSDLTHQQDELLARLSGEQPPPASSEASVHESVCPIYAELGGAGLAPNESQQLALSRCAANSLHYIWGPPGTGKTACVAQVARLLHQRGEKVMVLSHANAAVDAAMLKVADAFAGTSDLAEGRILRVGVPHRAEARERREILPEGVVERMEPELIARRSHLELLRKRIVRELTKSSKPAVRELLEADLSNVREELVCLRQRFEEIERLLIDDAVILGLTVSKLVVNDHLWSWPADAVLIDEVSMVNFPFVLAAGLKADRRIILFGDFRQLPPVVLSSRQETRSWLGKDAFERAGIKAAIDRTEDDARVTLLETQYRMHPAIGEVVNKLAYSSRLTTAASVGEATGSLAALQPYAGHQIVLIDTAGLKSVCLREKKGRSFSRLNPSHAALSLTVTKLALASGCRSLGVIAPYRGQTSLIYAGLERTAGQAVSASTVHRFQGSESDMIVFDFVDALPQQGASLLTGKDLDTALRLTNVALSRARGKLVLLADVPFIEGYHPPRSPARKALALARQYGKVAGVSDFLSEHGQWAETRRDTPVDAVRAGCCPAGSTHGSSPAGGTGPVIEWYENWSHVQSELCADLQRSDAESVVNLPADFTPSAPLIEAMLKHDRIGKLFAQLPNARHFEASSIDVRLMLPVAGFFWLMRDRAVYIGGRDPACPVVRIEDANVAAVIERLLFEAALRSSFSTVDNERELALLCGICEQCGEERRPRLQDDRTWVLRCPDNEHPGTPLEVEALQAILHTLQSRCNICHGLAVASSGAAQIGLSCPNARRGCQGRTPSMEELFGGG